jgi:ectoine hydroxylase-related dioxygenase (phytanoyl-CoA dioxygenase family)
MSLAIDLKEQFETDGFCYTPTAIPAELVQRVIPQMEAVIDGRFGTGVEPLACHFSPTDPPEKLKKVDQPHLADRTILEFISHPQIGRWAADITGAGMIQVWAVQLLVKPPGGSSLGNIGWHQDMQHWKTWWKGEVFTAWVAVSDVSEQSGPMRYVVGSHRWGLNTNPSFFRDQDRESQREAIPKPAGVDWREDPALLTAGHASFHHPLCYHGSGPNVSASPRRSFAIHLRTENSEPLDSANQYYNAHLDNPDVCPVIFQR